MTRQRGAPTSATFIEEFLPAGQSRPLRELIDAALYSPEIGYYQATIRDIGRRGDFATTATLGTALGRAISNWTQSQFRQHALPRNCIEIGAGNGSLASAILRAAPLFRRPHYHIVDTSPPLRALQQQRLKTKARWHESVQTALDACNGHAVILANELIDAFPPTVLQWHAGQLHWQEVCITRSKNDQWTESTRPWQPGPLLRQFGIPSALTPANWPEGTPPDKQRIEIHESFLDWWQAWLPHWRRGALLWIDYGDSFPHLYHRKPAGTLRAYFHHQLTQGPAILNHFGKQDITADVNFSDIQQWGTKLGLTLTNQCTQADFISLHNKNSHPDDPAIQEGPAIAFKVQSWLRE